MIQIQISLINDISGIDAVRASDQASNLVLEL